MKRKHFDMWSCFTILFLVLSALFLLYPMLGILKQAIFDSEGKLTLAQFAKFFGDKYYSVTILNSFKVTIAVTFLTLLIALPLSYFYTFYHIRGAKILFVVSILCSMSAPFIGAYAWIMLLGRSGIITKFFKAAFGITLGSIYGFKGIMLVQALKLFPLVFIYMNGAFRDIDASLLEAAESMGCRGVDRFRKVIMGLTMPTILAAALLVFMQIGRASCRERV